MRVVMILAVVLLSACGADGPPERPTKGGVSLSGEMQVGVLSN